MKKIISDRDPDSIVETWEHGRVYILNIRRSKPISELECRRLYDLIEYRKKNKKEIEKRKRLDSIIKKIVQNDEEF